MKILMTGFEPFGGEPINPSWQAVDRLPGRIADAQIEKMELPVCFLQAEQIIRAAIAEKRPDAVVMVGQAGGRTSLSVECVAVNLDDTRSPDNAGYQPENQPICADGPQEYPTTFPVETMVEGIRAAGVPADPSGSAGRYVCNHVMYCALHEINRLGLPARAGFLHVPYIPAQTVGKNAPSLPLEEIIRGLEAAVGVLCHTA